MKVRIFLREKKMSDGEDDCQLDAAGFYEKSRAEREAKYDQLRDCSV